MGKRGARRTGAASSVSYCRGSNLSNFGVQTGIKTTAKGTLGDLGKVTQYLDFGGNNFAYN